jgi:hypothetical protein
MRRTSPSPATKAAKPTLDALRSVRHRLHRRPFPFTGTVRKVTFDIKPHLSADDEHALHEAAHQGHVAHRISA